MMKTRFNHFINRSMAKVYQDRVDALVEETGISNLMAKDIVRNYFITRLENLHKSANIMFGLGVICLIILLFI